MEEPGIEEYIIEGLNEGTLITLNTINTKYFGYVT